MITELDRIIFIAMAAGFAYGLVMAGLDFTLRIKLDKQTISLKRIALMLSFSSLYNAVLFSIGIIALTLLDTSISADELNKFSIYLAVTLGVLPVIERVIYYIHSRIKRLYSQ